MDGTDSETESYFCQSLGGKNKDKRSTGTMTRQNGVFEVERGVKNSSTQTSTSSTDSSSDIAEMTAKQRVGGKFSKKHKKAKKERRSRRKSRNSSSDSESSDQIDRKQKLLEQYKRKQAEIDLLLKKGKPNELPKIHVGKSPKTDPSRPHNVRGRGRGRENPDELTRGAKFDRLFKFSAFVLVLVFLFMFTGFLCDFLMVPCCFFSVNLVNFSCLTS